MKARIIRSNRRCWSCQASSVMPLRSLRSPPAQNARSPAPVRTMQRCCAGAALISSKNARRSRPICVFRALATSGRFRVKRSSPSPRSSTRVVSYWRSIRYLRRGRARRDYSLAQRLCRDQPGINMSDRPPTGPLSGRRIALPETRELDRLARMLEERGAETLRCPMVAIRDAPDPLPVQEWLGRFPFDDLILYTGEGLRRLSGFAHRFDMQEGFLDGLRTARKITRGPKPERALRELGLKSDLRAETPTTEGLIATLSALDLRDRKIGVQLYPGSRDPVHGLSPGRGGKARYGLALCLCLCGRGAERGGIDRSDGCRRGRCDRLHQLAASRPVVRRSKGDAARKGVASGPGGDSNCRRGSGCRRGFAPPRGRGRNHAGRQLFYEASGYRHCGGPVAASSDSVNEGDRGGGEGHDGSRKDAGVPVSVDSDGGWPPGSSRQRIKRTIDCPIPHFLAFPFPRPGGLHSTKATSGAVFTARSTKAGPTSGAVRFAICGPIRAVNA